MNPQDSAPTPAPVPTSSPVQQGQLASVGSLFAAGWNLLTHHWKIIVPILIIPSVLNYIGVLLTRTHQGGLVGLGVLVSVASAIFSIAMMPALINAVHRIFSESNVCISLKDQYKIGFKYFWSVIFIAIIGVLISLGSFVLLVIPGIIVSVYAMFYVYTLVIDGKKGFSAFTESFSLVRGRWWPVLGRMIALMVIMIACWFVMIGLGFIIGLVTGLSVSMSSAATLGSVSVGSFIVTMILNLVASALIAPIGIGYTYKLYASLKATRQADAPVGTFKNWLVTYLVVGILALIAVPIIGTVLVVGMVKNAIIPTGTSLEQTLKSLSSTSTGGAPYMDAQGTSQGNRPGGAGPGPQ